MHSTDPVIGIDYERCDDVETQDPLDITIFGVSLKSAVNGVPKASDVVASLLSQINAVLAPLQPIFTLMEAITAIKDCLDSVLPPNPFKFADSMGKLIKVIAKILSMLPPMSVPVFIKGVLKLILVLVKSLRQDLRKVVATLNKATEAEQLVASLGLNKTSERLLRQSVECSRLRAGIMLDSVGSRIEPLQSLLGAIKSLGSLAGINIPDLRIRSGGSVKELLAALQAIEDALTPVVDLIPG